ncbi:MAG: hypothetical protein NTU57_05025 [Candidatus Aenigmarchaeota archaeon]|nr:hypothetical protein [Candidatus Aenigmarchaeota archaeon]
MRNIELKVDDDSFWNDKEQIIKYIQLEDFENANTLIQSKIKFENNMIDKNGDKSELVCNQHFIFRAYWHLFEHFIKCWTHLRSSPDDSWNHLQDCLLAIDVLDLSVNGNDFFDSNMLYNYLLKIESLFPYTMFNSVEYVTKKATCSICGNNPFSKECNHIKGDLYYGKRCYVTIDEANIIGMSLVENPANKKCIIFVEYDKKNVKYSPFGLVWQLSFLKPLFDFTIIYKNVSMTRDKYLKYLRNIEKNPKLPPKRIFQVEYKKITQLNKIGFKIQNT